MRESTNLNWLAGFLNHQQYHLVSQQFKQCEHELEWINGLYHVVMRLSRINGMGVESTQHLPNDEECQHWGKPMVNEPLIRPYFWEGTLEGCRLTSHDMSIVARAVIVGGRHCGAPEIAAKTSAVAAGVAAWKRQNGKGFFLQEDQKFFWYCASGKRWDGFFRCLVPIFSANLKHPLGRPKPQRRDSRRKPRRSRSEKHYVGAE